MRISKIYLLVVVCFLASCNPLPRTKEQLISYVNNKANGLLKYKETAEGQFTLSYRAHALLPGLPENAHLYWYFILSLSNQGREYSQNFLATEEGYTNAINKLAFGMSESTYAITNNLDTVYCSTSTFPRTYGSLDADKILLVFKKEALGNAESFRMKIEAIRQEFEYRVNDILKIQDLKIK
tara:strand:- start:788 stop:1333 length:546 start_codon:yes stop_codon:yes gene_type:complete